MERAVRTMTLRFTPEQHEKLVRLKKESKAGSWEEFILRIAGIAEDE